MQLVDAHTHAFPTTSMGVAWQGAVGRTAKRSGEIGELDAAMQRAGTSTVGSPGTELEFAL